MTITNQSSVSKRIVSAVAGVTAIAIHLWSPLALAGDVFRASNARNMGENTEAAFKAIFQDGNYPEAQRYLELARSTDANEPLTYAMVASFAYIESDWDTLRDYASKTLDTAQKLQASDPLRGNLYTGVGHFLQGVHTYKQQGALGAMSKLQQVFESLDEAKKIAPNDPEVNLLTGYMDLMLAVNLPFSDPSQGIQQLEGYAGPKYLADRGIAIGYRDLKQYDKALVYANRSLEQTPNNPELRYLKAQILAAQGSKQNNSPTLQQANTEFQAGLSKSAQLPKKVVAQMFYEYCQNQIRVDSRDRNCAAKRDSIKNVSGTWGPVQLPSLD